MLGTIWTWLTGDLEENGLFLLSTSGLVGLWVGARWAGRRSPAEGGLWGSLSRRDFAEAWEHAVLPILGIFVVAAGVTLGIMLGLLAAIWLLDKAGI